MLLQVWDGLMQRILLMHQRNGGMSIFGDATIQKKKINCNHVRLRKRGPNQLHDLDILFSNAHVTGVTTTCPGDLSFDDSGDDDIMDVEKVDDINEPKLSSVKKGKETKKRKIEQDKEEKSPFLLLYKTTCAQI